MAMRGTTKSEIVGLAASLLREYRHSCLDGVLDPIEQESLEMRMRELCLVAELDDTAQDFSLQLDRLPTRAPNAPLLRRAEELVGLCREWQQEQAACKAAWTALAEEAREMQRNSLLVSSSEPGGEVAA